MDIAGSTQEIYEKALFHTLNNLYSKYDSDNLSLAGGCAANSVANGKITQNTPLKESTFKLLREMLEEQLEQH